MFAYEEEEKVANISQAGKMMTRDIKNTILSIYLSTKPTDNGSNVYTDLEKQDKGLFRNTLSFKIPTHLTQYGYNHKSLNF